MIIKTEEANILSQDRDYHNFPINYLEEINIQTKTDNIKLKPEMLFRQDNYEGLKNASIGEINVFYTAPLIEKLRECFPAAYKKPSGVKNIVELDRIMEEIGYANANSQKKRHIISLSEMYRKTDAGHSSIIHYGEKIDHIRWNQLKSELNRNTVIQYAYSECGIIIFFILNPKDPDYPRKFMNFTTLVSMLVSEHAVEAEISGDFNPEKDVYTVNDPSRLLNVYHDTNASLIITGEDINEEYRLALTSLRAFDRYAKIMVIKNPDPKNIKEILARVKIEYNKNLWAGVK